MRLNVMNIKSFLSAAAAVVLVSACSEYDPGLSETVQPYTDEEIAKLQEYDANFTKAYGSIDANHTWGFKSQGSEDEIAAANTRGSEPRGNMWEDMGYTIPVDIEDEERLAVVQAFRTYKESNIQPNLTTFFVQQVYKGGVQYALVNETLNVDKATYTYADNTTPNPGYVLSSDHMDYLHCLSSDGSIDDHVFDFNYGNSDDWGSHYGGRMLMVNSSTQDFYYHNSYSNEDRHEYICLQVEWTDKNGVKKSGAYVGFDFYCAGENPNQQVERDEKYDDWIVKIVPAVPTEPDHNWTRVMCEDLGNTYDFDFNDLVFDVYFTGEAGNYVANIRVQASGGTLPIYLGFDGNEAYETHKILGQSTTAVPVNVGQGVTAPYKDITISMAALGKGYSTNPNDIPIYVFNKDAEGTKETTLLPPAGSTISKAPQKFCIPGNTTRWMKENKLIETSYIYFDEWVKNENGEYGYNGAKPWNKTDVKTANLY